MFDDEYSDMSERVFNDAYCYFLTSGIPLHNLDISLLLSNNSTNICYSKTQLDLFNSMHDRIKDRYDEEYDAIEDNIEKILSEDEIFSRLNENYFSAWFCKATLDCIYVSAEGNIYPCPCCHEKKQLADNKSSIPFIIGSIYNNDMSFRQKPILCPCKRYCVIPEVEKTNIFKK